jgi:hypothetical protein
MVNTINDLSTDLQTLEAGIAKAVQQYLEAVYTKDTDEKVANSVLFSLISVDTTTGEALATKFVDGHREDLMILSSELYVEVDSALPTIPGDIPGEDFLSFNR